MKKPEKSELSKLRAERLKTAVDKDKRKCKDCASKSAEDSPIKAMLQKLSGLPGLGGCEHSGPKVIAVKVVKTDDAPPVIPDKPVVGVKKVLEREVEEEQSSSPFVRKMVGIIGNKKAKDGT